MDQASVEGSDVHGPHEVGTGGGASVSECVGLRTGGDIGGDAAQGVGDVLERPGSGIQGVQRTDGGIALLVEGHGLGVGQRVEVHGPRFVCFVELIGVHRSWKPLSGDALHSVVVPHLIAMGLQVIGAVYLRSRGKRC